MYAKLIGLVLIVALAVAGIVGWCMNVWATVQLVVHDSPITTFFVGRIIGVFVPFVGAILGYF
jgi:hypothetical protein